MNSRPFILKGNITINSNKEYIIGTVLINQKVDEDRSKYILVLDKEHKNLFEKGYEGYIFISWSPENCKDIDYVTELFGIDTLINYDVIEFNDDFVRVLYRDDSTDNFIQVTNQCNSNCIMCPDAEEVRNTRQIISTNRLLRIVDCIPNDTEHICITGGEPGMIKYDLIKLLKKCRECLPNTQFLLLSNGRIFSDYDFTEEFVKNIPYNIRIGIPLYSDIAKEHDEITQVLGSFEQTITGLNNLLKHNLDIEIRVVVMKKNYEKLSNISKFICNNLNKVNHVNFMALEMTGNAHKNKENVWVNFNESTKDLYRASTILIKEGIDVNLYNFPICKIDKRLYSLAQMSISDYKVRYLDKCNNCKVKEKCGGFFPSTMNIQNSEEEKCTN